MNKTTLAILIMLCLTAALVAKPEMIRIYGGWMNVGEDEDEKPIDVRISDFELAKYELTFAEFQAFVKDTGYRTTAELLGKGFGLIETNWTETDGLSWLDPGFNQDTDHPASSLSWYDAISYCNWLSAKEKLTPAYIIDKDTPDPNSTNANDFQRWTVSWNTKANGYRLPTTAEWEFAASSGGRRQTYVWGDYSFDDQLPDEPLANLADVAHAEYFDYYDDTPWYIISDYDDGYMFTSPVGSYPPNALGLYDMAGNVSELCWDWHNLYYSYKNGDVDPKGPSSGGHHAQRGSAWCDAMEESSISYRRDLSEDYLTYSYIGMRLAKNAGK